MTMTSDNPDWWRGAVIYQIYPRSYQDSNADGIGDLRGITQRLAHIAALGADAVWLSPFYPSPMKDFGYDVSDYRDVDAMFGTLDDFRALVTAAHELNLRVLVDVVFSHTSDRHPWFVESRVDRDNAKADWYVWADAKADGSPPNNWLSIFGGSAWEWDGGRRQYYLHNFLTAQPDLNFHNRAVQDELLDITRFWLELGVDGFRMDTVNFYFHAQSLKDNPPLHDGGAASDNPYEWQQHLYDKSQPENLEFLRRFRGVLNEFPGATSVGEVGASRRGMEVIAAYTSGGDKLHMCYAFDFLSKALPTRANVESAFARLSKAAPDAWPCWSFSNHDVIRHATRWRVDGDGDGGAQDAWLRLLCALLLSLRGSVCLYQGEELGLTEAKIARDDLQDPYGIRFWPAPRGRDGCRTPMVWERDSVNGGFTDARPWLPLPPEHLARAVDAQNDAGLLAHYKRFIAFRKQHPALQVGDIRFLEFACDGDDGGDNMLAFVREHDGESLACVFNLDKQPATVTCDAFTGAQTIDGHGFTGSIDNDSVTIAGYNAWFGRLA